MRCNVVSSQSPRLSCVSFHFSNENASPDVPLDLSDSLDRLVPDGDKMRYRHDDEGPDDMPAHVKSSQSAHPIPFKPSQAWPGLTIHDSTAHPFDRPCFSQASWVRLSPSPSPMAASRSEPGR